MRKFAGTDPGSLVHRLAYTAFIGPFDPSLAIHHKCANRKCVNPLHLEPVSQRDNMGEMLLRKHYELRIAALEAENLALRQQLRH